MQIGQTYPRRSLESPELFPEIKDPIPFYSAFLEKLEPKMIIGRLRVILAFSPPFPRLSLPGPDRVRALYEPRSQALLPGP